MKLKKMFAASATATLLLTASLTPAMAQQTGNAQQYQAPPASEPQVREVGDAELDQYADAFQEIKTIQESVMTQLRDEQDPAQAQELQKQAQEKMVQAVQEAGLSVEDYNTISRSLHASPELQQQLQEKLANR